MYQPYPSSGQPAQPAGPPQPPQPVVMAVRLMYAGAVVSAISLIVSLVTFGTTRAVIERANRSLTTAQIHRVETAVLVFVVVYGIIVIGLWIWLALANRSGRNWARIVATVLFGLNTLVTLAGIVRSGPIAARLVPLLVWLIGLGAIVLLWQRESSDYFQPGRPR